LEHVHAYMYMKKLATCKMHTCGTKSFIHKQKTCTICFRPFRRTVPKDSFIDGSIIWKHSCLIFCRMKAYYLTPVCTKFYQNRVLGTVRLKGRKHIVHVFCLCMKLFVPHVCILHVASFFIYMYACTCSK
jgi:hypothetical protein